MARSLSNGSGLEIIDPDFRTFGLLALRVAFKIPSPIREALLFGRSKFCVQLQKALVSALGGAFLVQTRFTEGPMAGQSFACWTSEKYFMLGSHVENDLQQRLPEVVRAGDVVYDIGGHAGYTSLLFSTLVGTGGHVFSFEPSRLNYARIRGNMDANAKSNVTVVNAAVSDHEGVACLAEFGSMSAITCRPNETRRALSEVRTIRLDDFVYRDSNPPPSFVKIDIEGHAGPAFEGMTLLLASWRPTILCELHGLEEEEHASRILLKHRYSIEPIDARRKKFPWRALAVPQ